MGIRFKYVFGLNSCHSHQILDSICVFFIVTCSLYCVLHFFLCKSWKHSKCIPYDLRGILNISFYLNIKNSIFTLFLLIKCKSPPRTRLSLDSMLQNESVIATRWSSINLWQTFFALSLPIRISLFFELFTGFQLTF